MNHIRTATIPSPSDPRINYLLLQAHSQPVVRQAQVPAAQMQLPPAQQPHSQQALEQALTLATSVFAEQQLAVADLAEQQLATSDFAEQQLIEAAATEAVSRMQQLPLQGASSHGQEPTAQSQTPPVQQPQPQHGVAQQSSKPFVELVAGVIAAAKPVHSRAAAPTINNKLAWAVLNILSSFIETMLCDLRPIGLSNSTVEFANSGEWFAMNDRVNAAFENSDDRSQRVNRR